MILLLVALAVYYPVPDTEGGWRFKKPPPAMESKLDAAFDYVQQTTKHGGLLVVHRGWLIYERYFGRAHREATPNTASCGKAFTSIAVGILLKERRDLFPDGLDQKVFTPKYFPPEAFPLSDPARSNIRLGQLLAMSAGIRGNNPGYARGKPVHLDPAGPDGADAMIDSVAFGHSGGLLNTRTLWTEPGAGYSYATSSIHLASTMLRRVTGMELQQFLEERLARPMGWGRWGFGYKRPEITHTPGGGGIAIRSTDMLRFGYLLLRNGRWGSRRLVPADYIRHAGRRSPYNPHYSYSLQFNVNQGAIATLPRDAFWKGGSGGHAIYVVPSLDLVVWKIGGRDEQYNLSLTNVPPDTSGFRYDGSRDQWRGTIDPEEAIRRTLELVIDAVRNPSVSVR